MTAIPSDAPTAHEFAFLRSMRRRCRELANLVGIARPVIHTSRATCCAA